MLALVLLFTRGVGVGGGDHAVCGVWRHATTILMLGLIRFDMIFFARNNQIGMMDRGLRLRTERCPEVLAAHTEA